MRLFRAADDEKPRRVAVEPMHDPRTVGLGSTSDRVAEKLVYQRAGSVAGRWVHDEAGRLVDDQQVLVLMHHPGAQLLRLEGGRLHVEVDIDALPAREAVALRSPRAVDRDPSPAEQPLCFRARTDLVQRREEPVEPCASRVGAGRHGDARHV